MTDVPHFTLPLRFSAGTADVAEQDSSDEILSCVLAILLCPRGFRAELPQFGIDDPTFEQAPVDHEAIAEALTEWEPRAQSTTTVRVDDLDALVEYVRAAVNVPTGD